MPRLTVILGISVAILFIACGYSSQVSAQVESRPQTGPIKFDEFGSLGHCDLTARLDNFVIHIQNTAGAKGYVITYGPESEAGLEKRIPEQIKDYLINTRGLGAARLKNIYGGRNSDPIQPKIELWILPKGAQPPEPQKHETNIDTFKGLFVDDPAFDNLGLYSEEQGMGPGIGRTTFASYADMLHEQKDAVGYIVVYTAEDAAPGASRRIAQDEVNLLKRYNLEASRLKVIFGGHSKESRTQFWILPPDAPPPVPDAGPELPLNKTIKVHEVYAFDLKDERNQTAVITRLTEMLRMEKTARVFVVVRLEQPTPEEPGEDIEPPAIEEPAPANAAEDSPAETIEETEPVDLTKLVEKWQLELAKTHKIDADRFIVWFTPAREFEGSHLSLWIVPRGQPLPDPNEEEAAPEDLQEAPDNSKAAPQSSPATAPAEKLNTPHESKLPVKRP